MKIVIVSGLLLLGLIGATLLTKNNSSSVVATDATASNSMQTIENDIVNGGQFLDVRTAAEFREGHIVGAVNLSLQDIQAGALPTSAKDKPIYVYCRSGNRSQQASELLKKAGYQKVVDLGAMTSVQSLGGMVTK